MNIKREYSFFFFNLKQTILAINKRWNDLILDNDYIFIRN